MASYKTPVTQDAVRDYVTGSSSGLAPDASTLLLNVGHSNLKTTRFLELRMHRDTAIAAVKDRLYLHTGTRPAAMTLLLRSSERGPVRAELADERATLAQYGAQGGDWLHIVDADPHSVSANGWLEDTTLVPKYKLSQEAYAEKENTYRKFKAKMRETDPEWSMTSALAKGLNAQNKGRKGEDFAEEAPEVGVGTRVEVAPGGKRGEVRFVGRDLSGLPEGWWVGVRYDEPVGKNDGEVKGVRYFQADKRCGGLVRPSNVTVGDFPPLDDGIESEDEI